VASVAAAYDDYFAIGAGPRNLLAFGGFDLDAAGTSKLLRRGRIQAGTTGVLPVSPQAITEAVRYSWFEDEPSPTPPALGKTKPQQPKTDAYSWMKAPRYLGRSYEVGPLARMWINGDYDHGISVMDRHRARALEASTIANAMRDWLAALDGDAPVHTPYTPPETGQGTGLLEAPRGALGHWLTLLGGKLDHYQVVTPTCWNASPRDQAGVPGPLEQAIIGTPVADVAQPIEVLRVLHSLDPCLACAVHVVRPKRGAPRPSPLHRACRSAMK